MDDDIRLFVWGPGKDGKYHGYSLRWRAYFEDVSAENLYDKVLAYHERWLRQLEARR